HGDDVLDFERQPRLLMAHAPPGGVGHLAILQVIAGARKQIVVAAMVVVHVADDDGLDALRGNAKRKQAVAYRLDDLALAAPAHPLVEARIDDDRAGRTDDRPYEVVERLQHVVRIAADEILRRTARMLAVADGVDLVDVIAHVLSSEPLRRSYVSVNHC